MIGESGESNDTLSDNKARKSEDKVESDSSSEEISDSSSLDSDSPPVKKTDKGKGKAKENALPSVGDILFWLSHRSYHAQVHGSDLDADGEPESDRADKADEADENYVASIGAPSDVRRDHESRLTFLKGLSRVPFYQSLITRWSEYYVSYPRRKWSPVAKGSLQGTTLMANDVPPTTLPAWASWNDTNSCLPAQFHSLEGYKVCISQFSTRRRAFAGNWTFVLGVGLAFRDVDRAVQDESSDGETLANFPDSLLHVGHLDSLIEICQK